MERELSVAPRPARRALAREGFFISPDGQVALVEDSHIAAAVVDPERFGWTRETVEKAFRQHSEARFCEGAAREEILRGVLAAGWIRLRRGGNRGWAVEFDRLDCGVARRLRAWARAVLRGTPEWIEMDRQAPVRLHGLADGYGAVTDVGGLAEQEMTLYLQTGGVDGSERPISR